MAKKRLDIRNSAYGQLIFLVFLPICFLALVGSALVYFETMNANKGEQEALAKAILIRYQPLVEQQLPQILDNLNNSQTDKQTNSQRLNQLLSSLQTEAELQSVAILDNSGTVIASSGFKLIESWGDMTSLTSLSDNGFISDIATSAGMAYGVELGKHHNQPLWLFVDMDDQPIKLAQYRIALVLGVTGLLTILLLLLAINIYSRRWIEPIYQMRLYLHSTSVDTLQTPLTLASDGELNLLKEDLVMTLDRLHSNFQELKEHAEQTEDDLRLAFDEMEMQNISIRNSRDRAISTSEAKSAFLANISHELRTPLNSIDGFINLLARNGNLSSEQDLYVQTIRKSSAHLLALVNDVLDFSKIEAGKLVLDSHEFDLYDAIYDVADMLSPLASEKGLRMAVLFYNDVPLTMVGDALRLKQVLTNLVANAIKFTDSGDIVIKVSLDDMQDNHLTITVQDSGRGVPELVQSQLFKSFSQGDPSITRQYGGTGLGLVISKQLVQLMGGGIGFYDNHAENIASQGSTFWFRLPTNVDVLEVKNAADIRLPSLRKSNKSSRRNDGQHQQNLQVLLWINHPASMQVLTASLQPLAVDITQTTSLAGTLDKLKESSHKWDWVIVDSDGNNAHNSLEKTSDDMTALLKQLRLHYQGRLTVYGYQVALDNKLLSRYKTFALHEPLDKRQLYNMLDEKSANSPDSLIDSPPRWQGYRVLAVDDHLPNLLVLDALLAEQGIEVVTANSGFDAIEIISKQFASKGAEKPIDLIFMDIQMPRMSGHEASEQIRKINQNQPRIPIIALTAHGMSDERDKLMKSGIDDYVGKPISQSQLLQILQRWLGKKADNKTDTLSSLSSLGSSISHSINQTDMESITTVTAMSTLKSTANSLNNLPNTLHTEEQQYPAIDWEDALHRSANKPELASKLIIMMIDSINDEREALTQAWKNQDIDQLNQTAHRILGASRYAGVPALRHASQQLENDCLTFKNNYAKHSIDKHSSGEHIVERAESLTDLSLLTSSYQQLMNALDDLQNTDLSPWAQLRYHRLDEDDMTWKMI